MVYRRCDDRMIVNGADLECRWIGPSPDEAPTIVMLHEGLGCIGLWRDFPAELSNATGYGVFVYSRQGYGASDPVDLPRPVAYMHDEALKVLPELLDSIGFRRGILLGHSDGASIATIYAGGVQDHRVRGLVLFAPHFFVEDMSVAAIEAAKRDYLSGDLKRRLEKYHGPNVDCAFKGWNDAWLHPKFRDWNIEESIAHIRVPIFIVQGSDDEFGSVAQLDCAKEEAYCPVDAEILRSCGHALHIDQPEKTLALTTQFLNRLFIAHGEAAALAKRA